MFMTLMSNKLYDRKRYLLYEPLVYGYDNNNTVFSYNSPRICKHG